LTPMNASDLLRGALRASLAVLLLWWLGATAFADNLVLTGSNGREVTFAGIREATPQGLIAQMSAEGEPITIPWETLDLGALRERQPEIHAAYEAAQGGASVPLNLGVFGSGGRMAGSDGAAESEREVRQGYWPGWIDAQIGDVTFVMQMPAGPPRGILVYAVGDDGNAFHSLMGHELGSGQLGQLQAMHRLAIMSYEFKVQDRDPTKLPEFAQVEKQSGAQFLLAIDRIAEQTGRPELKDLPIAVYGRDRVGASVAYHFVQWRPDRILAAVVSKGAFYEAPPREDATEVPVLFIEGQYSNRPEVWQSDNHFHSVFAHELVAKSNWTFATEFRAGGEMSLNSEYFGLKYLDEMVGARLPEASPPGPKPSEEDEDEETEDKPEETKPSAPLLPAVDRSKGFVGKLREMETTKLQDPDAPLKDGETFIPTSDLARIWRGFVDGSLEPRVPGQDQ